MSQASAALFKTFFSPRLTSPTNERVVLVAFNKATEQHQTAQPYQNRTFDVTRSINGECVKIFGNLGDYDPQWTK
jgi:hypothetical protein